MKIDNTVCAICLESLYDQGQIAGSGDNLKCSLAPCGHIFHTHCILSWLDRSLCSLLLANEVSGLCPLCREYVSERELIPVVIPPASRKKVHRKFEHQDFDLKESTSNDEWNSPRPLLLPRRFQLNRDKQLIRRRYQQNARTSLEESGEHLENEEENLESSSVIEYVSSLNPFPKSRLLPLILAVLRFCLKCIYLAITDNYIFPLILLSYAVLVWWYGWWTEDDKSMIGWKGWWKLKLNNGWPFVVRNSGWKFNCNKSIDDLWTCGWKRGWNYQCMRNPDEGWKCDWIGET